MHVSVVSLTGKKFDGDARSITAKTTSGEITVLAHHRPLITVLEKGDIIVTDDTGAVSRFSAASGFLEIEPDNRVSILLD